MDAAAGAGSPPNADQALDLLRTLDRLALNDIARVLPELEDARTRLWIRLQTLNPGPPTPPPAPAVQLLTVKEVAVQLRFSPGHVYELSRSGRLRVIREGRTIRIPREALTEWQAAHEADRLDASRPGSGQSLGDDDPRVRDDRAQRPGRLRGHRGRPRMRQQS
jgi:excisionase family DNA binding protein